MDLRQLVMLALQASILSTVFGFGLKASFADLLYVIRRPGLLLRSLLAVFVVMPVLALVLVRVFDFPRTVEIVLIALAISPVPPILPKKETRAGGHASFGLGLMAILSLTSIVAVPVAIEILQRLSGRSLAMAPGAIAGIVLKTVVVPLAAGMIVARARPAIAERLHKVVSVVVAVLLPLAIAALLAGAFSAIWALIGENTILALAIFTVVGLAVGHVLGGPDPDHAVVVALSTACRHPAIALAVATTNFPDQRFGALILLYLLVNAIIGLPYLAWQKRHAAGVVRVAR